MKKLGWDIEVDKILQEAARTPFKWGSEDCLCVATRCIQAASEIDVLEGNHGGYENAREGLRLLLKHRDSMEGIFSAYFKEIPVTRAQRGDAVIAYLQEGPTCGVVALDGKRVALKAENGLLYIPLTAAVRMRAWRVECPRR